jgi:hypothetical protein
MLCAGSLLMASELTELGIDIVVPLSRAQFASAERGWYLGHWGYLVPHGQDTWSYLGARPSQVIYPLEQLFWGFRASSQI